MKNNSQLGFGLPMVIISASIMSVLALGISNMMVNNSSSIAYLEDRANAMDFKNVLTLELSNTQACTNSLAAINLSSSTLIVNDLRDQSNSVIRSTNDNYDMLSIGSMRVDNISVPVSASSTGIANLIVPLNRLRGKQVLKSLTIPIQITTTAAAPFKVASCVAVGDAGALLTNNAGKCDKPPPLCAPFRTPQGNTRYCTYTDSSSPPYEEGSLKSVNKDNTEDKSDYTWTYVCINKKWTLIDTVTRN